MMTRKFIVFYLLLLITLSATGLEDIEITEASAPSFVEKGEEFTVTTKVENKGDADDMVRVIASAMGQRKVTEREVVFSGESKTFQTSFKVPLSEKTGPFKISLKAETGSDIDHTNIKSEVSSVKGYMTLNPKQTKVGEPVMVKGRLTHSGTGSGGGYLSANVYEGNRFISKVKTDNQGYFQTYYTPERTGSTNIRLVNDGVSLQKKLMVEPVLRIESLEVSDRIYRNREGNICVEPVFRGVENANVVLEQEIDGNYVKIREKEAINSGEKTCLRLETDKIGLNRGKIRIYHGRYSETRDFNFLVEKKEDEKETEETDTKPEIVNLTSVEENGTTQITAFIEIGGSEEKEMKYSFIGQEVIEDGKIKLEPGTANKLMTTTKKSSEEVKLELETENQSSNSSKTVNDSETPSGMLGYSMTGLKVIGLVVGLAFIVLVLIKFFNPNALEPER